MGREDGLLPRRSTKTNNSYFNAYLDSEMPVSVLTHEILLDMGQGGLKAYFDAEISYPGQSWRIPRIWQDLLITIRSTAITDRHLTAACNAMCVFLQCACSSSLQNVRDFGMLKETWLQCFGAILECFEEAKVKPMRQVLITLANILTHNPNRAVSDSIQKEVMTQMTGIILSGESGHVKAALIAMDLFIRRISSFYEVLQSIKSGFHRKQVEWSRRLSSFGVEKAVHNLPLSASVSDSESTKLEFQTTIAFVISLLMALLSRETQSAAIALYRTYSAALIGSGKGFYLYSMSTSKREENLGAGHINDSKAANPPPWIFLVQAFLEVHPAAVTPFTDFLFPAVFKHDPSSYKEYADMLQKGECNLINLLAVVQVGCHMGLERNLAFTIERSVRGNDVPSGPACDIFGALLSHCEADIRIRTFALLLAPSTTTAPLPTVVLQCLKASMKYLYGDADPQSRGEVMSIVRKLVIRLQGGSYSLHKSMLVSLSQSVREATDDILTGLRQHEEFLAWFAKFLESELRPDASYQRHIMALKSIELLVRSGADNLISARQSTEISRDQAPWPVSVSLCHPSIICALLNLLMDPFEDVRASSSILLDTLAFVVTLRIQKPVRYLALRAEELASRTGRSYHADGAARLYKLDYTLVLDSRLSNVSYGLPAKQAIIESILLPLQGELASIEGDLDVPLQNMSLHTRLLSLRYILQDDSLPDDIYEDETLKSYDKEGFLGRVIYLCQQVWQKVRTRLCSDSPENAEDDFEEELSVGPKDILSYSWRALRDSSLLVCAILDTSIFRRGTALNPLSLKHFESIGLLCMDQLSNLRHRGAFSTVAQTFSALCGRIGEFHDSSATRLRDIWYESAVATIDQQATRLTRRSAGLPAMIVGLLNGCSQTFFERFIESFIERSEIPKNSLELFSKSDDLQIELPQVHALNCLRDVVTNAKFRSITEPHLVDMLNLAAMSLSCDVWAIRNCGLMLFRACTSRLGRPRISLLSVKDTSQSWTSEATVSNERSHHVVDLAMKLLDPACFSARHSQVSPTLQPDSNLAADCDDPKDQLPTERVFAALDLIGRISPSFHDADQIERIVLENSSSKVWHVRARAARVCASCVSSSDALDLLGRIADGMNVQKDQNTIHGRLLCIKQIIRLLCWSRAGPQRCHLRSAASILKPLIAHLMVDRVSSVIRTTFLDILNDAFEIEILSRTPGAKSTNLSFWVGESILKNAGLAEFPDFPKHESAAVHQAYQFFSIQYGPEQELPSISKLRRLFLNLAEIDLNAAASFLTRIASHGTWPEKVHYVIDDLYLFIIPHDFFPEDIKLEAMTGLTASIESKRFNSKALMNKAEISWCLYNVKPLGRDLRNAKLRLEANLFTLSSSKVFLQVNAEGNSDLSLWIAMLEDATWDDIDTPTRFSAASSLLAFMPVLLSEQPTPASSSQYLQIYLLLYDLLNDDDEGVRNIASSAASMILSYKGTVPAVLMKQSPLAVSEKLAFFLGDSFPCEGHFRLAVLKRIWFSSIATEKRRIAEHDITKSSVNVLLRGLQQNLNALFEEERQNLYIDEVREVEMWSKILKNTEPPEEAYLNPLGDWALTGLRDLIGYLKKEVDFDGPLGLTSQGEILKLFVRVIELAGVSLFWAGRQPFQGAHLASASDAHLMLTSDDLYDGLENRPTSSRWAAYISLELKALEELGRKLCVHDRIMQSIQDIIQKQ